jgi:hypothetical protein
MVSFFIRLGELCWVHFVSFPPCYFLLLTESLFLKYYYSKGYKTTFFHFYCYFLCYFLLFSLLFTVILSVISLLFYAF